MTAKNYRNNANTLIFIASVVALSAAWIAQYMGYPPCKLCIFQRIPYYFMLVVALLGFVPNLSKVCRMLILPALGASCVLAFFHTGVEQGWWRYVSTCSTNFSSAQNLEHFNELLSKAEVMPCTVPTVTLFGYSMAIWNTVYSILLTITYSTLLLWKPRRQN